jgi:hypothetical protein
MRLQIIQFPEVVVYQVFADEKMLRILNLQGSRSALIPLARSPP